MAAFTEREQEALDYTWYSQQSMAAELLLAMDRANSFVVIKDKGVRMAKRIEPLTLRPSDIAVLPWDFACNPGSAVQDVLVLAGLLRV